MPAFSLSEKYFFEENTGYKENLSARIEFRDVDSKDVTILKDVVKNGLLNYHMYILVETEKIDMGKNLY